MWLRPENRERSLMCYLLCLPMVLAAQLVITISEWPSGRAESPPGNAMDPARPMAVTAITATTASPRRCADAAGPRSQLLPRSSATLAIRVPISNRQQTMSGRPTASGWPVAGPKGRPAVRESSHNASGPAETTDGRHQHRAVPADRNEAADREFRGSEQDEEHAGRGPFSEVLGHDGGVDDGAAEQSGHE